MQTLKVSPVRERPRARQSAQEPSLKEFREEVNVLFLSRYRNLIDYIVKDSSRHLLLFTFLSDKEMEKNFDKDIDDYCAKYFT